MSQEYEYDNDIKLVFYDDGTIDIAIDNSGDIKLTDYQKDKIEDIYKEITAQRLQLAFMTPYNRLYNPEDNTAPRLGYGSLLHDYIGRGDMTEDILRIAVIQTIMSVPDIVGIDDLYFKRNDNKNSIYVYISIRIAGVEDSITVRVVIL